MTSQTPTEIVTDYLDNLARGDVDAATAALDDDIVYTNVSLPTIRGSRKVKKIFAALASPSVGFDYRMINIAADDAVVLTERVDELRFGRLAIAFWVCGRFEIREGRISLWRDYFDYYDMTIGLIRGLIGIAVPAARRPMSKVPGAALTPTEDRTAQRVHPG